MDVADATTGVPRASDSSRLFDSPSERLGNTAIVAPCMMPDRSGASRGMDAGRDKTNFERTAQI